MIIETTRFGPLEIPTEGVIDFPEGLPGFDGKRYVILNRDETPMIEWLQSVDEPDVAVMIIDPAELMIEYDIGVRTITQHVLKQIDEGFFDERVA